MKVRFYPIVSRSGRFSSERIVRFITQLDRDIDIAIRTRDASHETGRVSVLFAV